MFKLFLHSSIINAGFTQNYKELWGTCKWHQKVINPVQFAKIISWWVPSILTLLFVEIQTKIVRQRNQTRFLVTPLSFACLHGRLWPLIILIPVPISSVGLKSQAGILQTVHFNVSCTWVLRHHFTLSCTWTNNIYV